MSASSARVLFRQDQLPVFQNHMYDTAAAARNCPKGDVVLVEDPRTGLIYNEAFRAELMNYDAHYQNEQGVSPLFRKHLEAVAGIVDRQLGRRSLVEVGCGKGLFLEKLQQLGCDITGFDPTYEGTNPRVRQAYFEPGTGITAKGLVLRHVLEHIADPVRFLMQLRDANGGSGRIYIEVPCFDWICSHRAWFDIFYEHVNYFRLSDFQRMFGRVLESGRLFGDQYLYVVAELGSLHSPVIDPQDRAEMPADFATMALAVDATTHAALWGGASKGVIFALLRERAGHPVSVVIDINPAKQGKYLPGTGLLVQSPEAAMRTLPRRAAIYVMNSNYLEEIRKLSGDEYTYIVVDR